MKKIKIFALILSLALVLCGCGNNEGSQTDAESTTHTNNNTSAINTDFSGTDADMFTDRDYEVGYDTDTSVSINLNGGSVSCSSDTVNISGTTVTIKDEGTYIVSGTLTDGMLIVDAEETDKPHIVLKGASVTSKSCAPLYILNADKVFVTLTDETENVLSNGGSFTAIDDNNIDGAVFSKQDLTFNGSGSLTVTSPDGHGIVCKDDLVFTSGTYAINSASHGIDANDSVRIANADITIDAGKDGIHTENNDDTSKGFFYASSGKLNIEAEGDGISSALYSQINGGTFDITAGGGSENATQNSSENYGGFMGGGPGMGNGGGMGGRDGMVSPTAFNSVEQETDTDESTSMKGIKASGDILISDGSFKINSADDGIHSDTSLTINGGNLELASGDDGIHAEEALTITDGTINITESYEGLEALNISVSGGKIKLVADDDGLNAAGGTDSSGFGGRDNGDFGGRGPNGMGGASVSSNGTIFIYNGELYINASGDGIDANGSLEISGGYTVVTGPTQGDTATLDYDTSAVISGGTFIGTGASGMAQTFSESQNQGIIAVSVGSQPSGTEIAITDSNGNTVISHSPELDFSVAIISSPDIVKGEQYTVTVGGASAEFEAE